MGQKVNPIGMRLGIVKTWTGKWYAEKGEFASLLHEDLSIEAYIRKHMRNAGISQIDLERAGERVELTVHASRPGVIIGRKGEAAEALKKELVHLTGREAITIKIREVKRPEIDAQLIAENIAGQLERRSAFRRVVRRALSSAMRLNIAGCKIKVGGRLNGAEMSRQESFHEGRVPLHTLRADVDYGTAEAHTTYGQIGVKVWVYKGENYHQQRTLRRRHAY